MLRLLIKLPIKCTKDKSIIKSYSNTILNEFKVILLNKVNYIKISIRYDYLISNNILQFNGKPLDYKQIIQLLLSNLKISNIQTNNNNYKTSIILPDYILIPNSNMSFSHFLKFIEFGNFDMIPYHWFTDSWNIVKNKHEKE